MMPGCLLDDRAGTRSRTAPRPPSGGTAMFGRVGVDDGRARVDARERVLRLLLGRRRHVRVARPTRDAVERGFDDHRGVVVGHLYSVARVRTRITELLGIEYPIVQAPMGYIARAQLASAVSNAGGLGIIETSSGRLEEVRDEIVKMRDLTDKPFGVNIAQLFVRDESIVDFVAENGVTFVTTSAGDPTKFTRALKDAGHHRLPRRAVVARRAEGRRRWCRRAGGRRQRRRRLQGPDRRVDDGVAARSSRHTSTSRSSPRAGCATVVRWPPRSCSARRACRWGRGW